MTVIVRSNLVSVSTRRALAARPGGIANVNFLTLRRLAEQIAGPTLAETGRRPVSIPLITAAIRSVLREDPGVFAPVAQHPSTEEALTSAYRELRSAPETSLDAVAGCSARAADVIRIDRAARERLADAWFDEDDLLGKAAALLASGDARTNNPVVVHLASTFTTGESALVNALARQGSLAINIGLTGDTAVDDATSKAYELAEIAVTNFEPVPPPTASHIISASDPDDEVRAVVRAITGWMDEGVRLGRVAVLYPTADPYARLIQEQFEGASLPLNGAPVRSIGDMLYGRVIRNLLALSERDFRRSDVLTVLADAPILNGDDRVPSRAWERVSRAAGVVRGSDWDERLRRWATAQRRRADVEAADDLEERAKHRRLEADRAEALSAFVIRLQDELNPQDKPRSWTEAVGWIVALADRYLGTERRRISWPEDEQQAADRVEEALERLVGLDAIGGSPPTLELFRQTLDSELSVALRRVGRPGDGVYVGQISSVAGMVFDRVAILGLSEGRFPPRRLEDPLLPDVEREAASGHLQLRSHRVNDDRRDLLAAVASADHALLSYPRGDLRRSTNQPASRWLLDDAARLAGLSTIESDDIRKHSGEPWLTHVASFAGGLALSPQSSTEQQLRLAPIARGQREHQLINDDGRTRAALEVVRARRSTAFTRFDGNLGHLAAKIGPPEHISTSRLEAWAKCPRAYLFGHVLGVERVDEPERRFEMDPLTRGSIVHKILEDFIVWAVGHKDPLDKWTADDHDRLQSIAEKHFDDAEREGNTGRAILWRAERMRLANDLRILLDTDALRLASGYRPIRAEMKFNDVAIPLPSGHTIRARGSIDRVDLRSDGSLAVIDYKTGSSSSYSSLSEADPHHHGKQLQLFVYSRAALTTYAETTEVRADYWFTKENKQKGYRITEAVSAAVTTAIDSITHGIGAGVFPAHPSDQPAWGWVDCWFCTPDGLSDQHERRAWLRKQDDPALSGYRALLGSNGADVDD